MTEDRTVDRREFTLAAALAMLSGVAITISGEGCGSGYGTTPTPTPTATPTPTPSGGGDKVGVVSSNHGHSAVITGAQLTAGGALQLNIQGTASHPHTVSLSAADIGMIAANQKVARDSTTNNSHSHTVTFN